MRSGAFDAVWPPANTLSVCHCVGSMHFPSGEILSSEQRTKRLELYHLSDVEVTTFHSELFSHHCR